MDQESKTSFRTFRQFGHFAFYLVPVLVICSLWVPVFFAYRVPGIMVTDAMVQQARESPPDATLEELKAFRFLTLGWKDQQQVIDSASGMLAGRMQTEGCSTPITMPFSADDLQKVPPDCELLFAAFVVPDVLLQAYEATGRKEFFSAAEAVITRAQAYEQSAWLPRGEFWNDHAVAARICVLANFWRLYRHSPDFRPEVARQVLEMVARSEQLLAKPGQFTFSTNHGIVQNLALWHAVVAFPSLPRTEEYRKLAGARLNDQLKFYISPEGVVLEHSAGYHQFGLELLGLALRYLDLMHQPVPPDWREKYTRAEQVYAALRRPDGSLPVFGDTQAEANALGPLVTSFDPDKRPRRLAFQADWKPAEAINTYPASGYSIWWDGLEFWPHTANLSQTVVAWSNFPGQAHKHADEMSVLFWAGGQSWLSNIGYWPYDSPWRDTIVSWPGSDAPHLVGESPSADRTTRLVSSGSSDHLAALELERRGEQNYVARRQLIHWKPSLWLVLDDTWGLENSRTTTTWTAAPYIRWQAGQTAGWVRLESLYTADRVDLFVLGSKNTVLRSFHGSSSPFAGWQVKQGEPVPASALVIEQPARDAWAATIWIWEKAGQSATFAAEPEMIRWTDTTDWEMRVPARSGVATLLRQGNTLRLHSETGTDETMELEVAPDVSHVYAGLRNNFAVAASRYHIFSTDSRRRIKVTYLLVAIFLLQQIFFLAYKRLHGPRVEILKSLNLIAWIAGGIWLVGFFF